MQSKRKEAFAETHVVWTTVSFPRAVHNPERLNKNAPLAIVAELPSLWRSFITNTWLGSSSARFVPVVPTRRRRRPSSLDRSLPVVATPAAARLENKSVAASASLAGDSSRLESAWRFFKGTGSRVREDLHARGDKCAPRGRIKKWGGGGGYIVVAPSRV